jgi:hypothetical protein
MSVARWMQKRSKPKRRFLCTCALVSFDAHIQMVIVLACFWSPGHLDGQVQGILTAESRVPRFDLVFAGDALRAVNGVPTEVRMHARAAQVHVDSACMHVYMLLMENGVPIPAVA